MIPRKKLDIGWSDLLAGLVRCLVPGSPSHARWALEAEWAPGRHAVATLSVRSGFDLLLEALDLPPGSEVLVSAVNIGDMMRILEHHELVPVPVDMDMEALAVDADALERAVTPRTRALVVAHLFGSRMPMEPLVRFAHERDLFLVEDCAQAYAGPEYHGHPDVDVALFSFGPIKTNTALGGGLLRFHDPLLAHRVRSVQEAFPVQSRTAFLRRVLKYIGIKALLLRPCYSVFCRLCALSGRSHDEIVSAAARGFAGSDLIPAIRHHPSYPLLELLRRRLRRFRPEGLRERARVAATLDQLAPGIERPGRSALVHSHWVVPVRVPDPEGFVRELWKEGLDATRGASNLHAAPAPEGFPPPLRARRCMDEVVYLPVYPGMPARAIRRLARALSEEVPSCPPSRPAPRSRPSPTVAGTSS